jgi:hypothetical protein
LSNSPLESSAALLIKISIYSDCNSCCDDDDDDDDVDDDDVDHDDDGDNMIRRIMIMKATF